MRFSGFILTEKGETSVTEAHLKYGETELDSDKLFVLEAVGSAGWDTFDREVQIPSKKDGRLLGKLLREGYIEEAPPMDQLVRAIPDGNTKEVLETYMNIAQEKPVPEVKINRVLNLLYGINEKLQEEGDRPEEAEEMNLEIDKTITRDRSEKVLLLDKIMAFWHHSGPWISGVGNYRTIHYTGNILQRLSE